MKYISKTERDKKSPNRKKVTVESVDKIIVASEKVRAQKRK